MNESALGPLLNILCPPAAPSIHEPNAWEPGTILKVANGVDRTSRRFLVLDDRKPGSALALEIVTVETAEAILNPSEGLVVTENMVVDLRKVYFEAMLVGTAIAPATIEKIGQATPLGIRTVINHLWELKMPHLDLQWLHAQMAEQKSARSHPTLRKTNLSDQNDVDQNTDFDFLVRQAHILEQFLDLVGTTLTENDYEQVRQVCRLPNVEIQTPAIFWSCDCGRHNDKNQTTSDLSQTNIKTVRERLETCVAELGVPAAYSSVDLLRGLGSVAQALNFTAGDAVHHHFVPKPSYIQQLPVELALQVVELLQPEWDRLTIVNLSLTCKYFNEVVNSYLYRYIAMGPQPELWDKIVRLLPKYGHHTREIYLESPEYLQINRRVVFENLRAIGDFCPRLERLDLNCPLQIDLGATEADLPPKIDIENLSDANSSEDGTSMDSDSDDDISDDESVRSENPDLTNARRVCAELDHIIKNCTQLRNFSSLWTGHEALSRFYQKVPGLKAVRLTDDIPDRALINLAKHCREIERFYIEGEQMHRLTIQGLTVFLRSLHTGKESNLRRIGLYGLRTFCKGEPQNHEMEEDEEDAEELDTDDNDEAEPVRIPSGVDPRVFRMCRFLDQLALQHPFLERLALVRCHTDNGIVASLGRLENLRSLDLSTPIETGLTSPGVVQLVAVFKGKKLASLNLCEHRITETDMATLTGENGLKTLRYIKVTNCLQLAGKYPVDEWVHPDLFVRDGGELVPRPGAGKTSLDIGEGWKEPWSE